MSATIAWLGSISAKLPAQELRGSRAPHSRNDAMISDLAIIIITCHCIAFDQAIDIPQHAANFLILILPKRTGIRCTLHKGNFPASDHRTPNNPSQISAPLCCTTFYSHLRRPVSITIRQQEPAKSVPNRIPTPFKFASSKFIQQTSRSMVSGRVSASSCEPISRLGHKHDRTTPLPTF